MEEPTGKRESDQKEEAEIQDKFPAVIQNVMAHLVRHDLTNFGQRALLEQIVIERDARGAEQTGNIRADARSLA